MYKNGKERNEAMKENMFVFLNDYLEELKEHNPKHLEKIQKYAAEAADEKNPMSMHRFLRQLNSVEWKTDGPEDVVLFWFFFTNMLYFKPFGKED